ncbi:UDP-Glycosyltransferase superfamily protein [Prunus dulcis]|uniref:UDP-Glycosyltransferase superfamily protein n=1 Tax=Prunus dulcis TaxID=3755 RepID=A0A4Y1R0D8_PRUDU|nr:UDP-Glycosyltransferase superfamily protein [Prunus dulcis]
MGSNVQRPYFALSKDQVFEIAYGLELSELPFLWALRKPNRADSEADARALGFADRTSKKGLVSFGWALNVLVVLTFIIDQPLNARLLVEKDLAVEVKRTEDGRFAKMI